MTKPVWSHVLALSLWTLKKAHIVSCHKASTQITNICMQGKYLTNWGAYKVKVKSCYSSFRLGTVNVLVSSGIDFVNNPRLYSDRATR